MILNEPLENAYFNWLCAKVILLRDPTLNVMHAKLFHALHSTEFVWLLIGDDNRAQDGKALREEFILVADIPDDPEWRTLFGCSVLEMLVAFSRRAEFQTSEPAPEWFWEFITNLGLNNLHNGFSLTDEQIHERLDRFIWRTYSFDGVGGMFPIREPTMDQREIEIWYQFTEYLIDQGRLQ